MKTESAYSFLLNFMLAFYFLGTSSWSHADESPIGPEFSSHIKSIVDNTSNFDAEIQLNFSDLGNGKINNGKPFYLTKDSIPGMILWLDANNSATISKAQGSKVYRGNQVTAYQNLVAYWTFEEGVGTSTADVSGNGNDAKFFGNPTFTADNAGKFGRAIDFDHNGDYLKVSHFAGVTTSNFVSASAWVKLDTLGTGNVNDSAIIGSASNDAHTFLLWYNHDGTETSPSYSFNVGNTSNLSNRVNSSANSVVANTWQHVVGTYNMGTKKIYVNGVLKGTTTNSTTQISPVGQDFYIGAWDGITSEMRMDGFVDDLRVYNIELSQAQVTAIYGNGSGDIGSAVTPGPLVVTAPANTDRVLFWGDLSNEENHARITNMRTSGREPHYKTNAQNGLPAIQFADDYLAMSNGDSASFDGLETYTFLVVAKGNSNREDWRPILSKRGDGGMGWQFRTRGGDTRMTMTSLGTTGTDDPSGNGAYQVNMRGQWHFWTVRYDGLKKLQRGDGRTEYNLDDTGAIAPAPDRYMTLGARHDSGTSFSNRGNWEIGEVLFFDRAVSDDEMYMLENHLQSKWNIPFLDVAHPRAGKTPDFSGSAVGADVSIYWGLSDGGENKAAWDNVARIGNIFRKDTTANAIELRGYDSFREENYFDLGRSDKGYLGVAASGVSVLTNGPGNRGFDFNSDSDFMNAGIGITNGDQFADMGIGYFTAQEAGAHTFGYTHSDDRALFCLDLDQDGNFEWNGDKGQEILCTRNWSTWAITAFPGDYHYSTNQRTVTLSPGDYKFVVMHIEYGEGSGVEFRFGTPSVAFPTVIKPTDSAQAGMWSIQKLSNGNDIETQLNRVAQLNNLPKDKTFYFRAHASNSHGEDWADETASFVTENKLDFNYGKITFDTTNGTWSHTSGRSGVGTIVTENWTSPTGDTLGFKKTKYTFDSIKLSGNLEVEAYGQYPLSLNTVNNGDIEILVDINASGGAGTGVEARNSGNRDNFVTGGNAPGGKGVLGAGSGGDSVKQNGQGRPGGEPTNLVNTTVNGGGGYSNTVWEIETAGGGGSYAGQATVGSNNRGEVAGKTYGDRKLTALIGGSGGSGASGWWDGGQQRERGAGAGGGGGGAIEFVADGNGSIVISTGVKILADGGDIPNTNYANETDNWRGGNGGGGSGGAIRLSAKNITNNGYLSATGGDRYHPTYGGAGGGGRIAMIARSSLKAGMYDVSGGGDGNELIIAENGSVYLEVNSFPLTYSTDLNTSVDLEMIWVEPGNFTMGSPENELYRDTSETEHNVTLTRGFYLGKYEVTQAQYEALINAGPPVYDLNASAARELTFNGYEGSPFATAGKYIIESVTNEAMGTTSIAASAVEQNATGHWVRMVDPTTSQPLRFLVWQDTSTWFTTKGINPSGYFNLKANEPGPATPQWPGNPNRPVERISWSQVESFLEKLNEKEAANMPHGWSYFLPSEAQWEYACRAGTSTAYSWGDTISASDANWNHGNDANQTENVGSYPANPWGFFDMHGNVWEWTNDRHRDYSVDPQTDPEGSSTATERIYRGGSWTMTAAYLRSANRYSRVPWYSANNVGFRIAYGYTNKAPTDLNSTAPLTVAENQPVGTIVGEFNATDPEGDTLTYHFVSGENNNSLFTLETNGTLKTAATLDYESVSLITIRVRVKDDLNESTEGSFIVSVENVNEPATGTVEIVGTPNIGEILTISSTITDPDGPPTFEYQWLRDGVPIKNSIINGTGGVDGLDGADSLCISPDGIHVYVTGSESDSVNCFERNTVTGALEHVSSIFDEENGVDGLDKAMDVEISGDGKHVYITATHDKSISWFIRNTVSGALTYGGTLKDNIDGVDGLDGGLLFMKISDDGDHIYVSANGDNSVSWFSRNKTTGALTFTGILKDGINSIDFLDGSSYVTLSHDGLHVYVTAQTDNTISWFDRNSVSGDLQLSGKITGQTDIGESLAGIDFINISNDDKKVFLLGGSREDGSLYWFDRNVTDGSLTFSGSLHSDSDNIPSLVDGIEISISSDDAYLYITSINGSVSWFEYDTTTDQMTYSGRLQDGQDGVDGLGGALDIELSNDGNYAYITGSRDNAISWFKRNPSTGALSYFSAYQSNYEVREADSGKDLSVNLSYREGRNLNSFTSPELRINQPPNGIYLSHNPFITNIYFIENLPIGSSVTKFSAYDPDGDSISFQLVSGEGDDNNSLFDLNQDGTLVTARLFDYESNASTYKIRVQASDQLNAHVEANFTIFLRDAFEGNWSTITAPDLAAYASFGMGISSSETSNLLALGSYGEDMGTGSVYIYKLDDNGTKTFVSKIYAPDKASGDLFGIGLSISQNHLAVGAMSADIDGVSDAGAVYIYKIEDNGTTTFVSKIYAPDKANGDDFGVEVTISQNLLLVGAMSADFDGVPDAGAVYIYKIEDNGTTTFVSKIYAPNKANEDNFGSGLSISQNHLAVGAMSADIDGVSDAGTVYIYKLEDNGTTTFVSKISAADKATDDNFGVGVSISQNILFVGASSADVDGVYGSGAVYMYELKDNGSGALISKISAPDKASGDLFGLRISQKKNFLLVGAHDADSQGFSNVGKVYLMDIAHLIPNRAPLILESETPLTIAENQLGGAVTGKLTANDPDGDELQWSISGGDDSHLVLIDPATGTLSLKNPSDYEKPLDKNGDNILELIIRVTDSKGLFSEKAIKIAIQNLHQPLVQTLSHDYFNKAEEKGIPIFSLTPEQVIQLVGRGDYQTPLGNYYLGSYTTYDGITYAELVKAKINPEGIWQLVYTEYQPPADVPPLNLSAYRIGIQSEGIPRFNNFINSLALKPVGYLGEKATEDNDSEEKGLPIFSMSPEQANEIIGRDVFKSPEGYFHLNTRASPGGEIAQLVVVRISSEGKWEEVYLDHGFYELLHAADIGNGHEDSPYFLHLPADEGISRFNNFINSLALKPVGFLGEKATEENHSGAQGTLAAHFYGFKNNTELKKGWEIGSLSIEKENGEPVQKEYIFEMISSSELFSVSPEGMLKMKKRLDLQQKSKWNFMVSYSSDGEEGKAIVNLNVEGNLSRPLQVSVDMMELVERGLPVYDFSTDQSFELSGKNEYIVTPAGSYIVEDVTRFSGETVTQMVQVQKDSAGNWQRVKDTYTGLEANFLVLIDYDDWLDTQNIHPIGYLFETVESLVQKNKGSKVQLLGKTLANGGSEITSYGFIWSDNPTFKNSHSVRGTLLLDYQQEMIFEANVSGVLSDTLYYKAFVENAEGLIFGAPKLIELEGIELPWWKEFPVLSGDWRTSWIGDFQPYDNGWIYHLQFGWTYVVNDNQGGIWLWKENYGWLWTKEGVYPYLWQHNKSEWFYLISGKGSSSLLYQHSTKTWEKLK